jgi:4-amino-4-deoxy-L-arabinose transferase-like glycosyltransferase
MSSGSSAARPPARGGRAVAGAVGALRRAGTPLAWVATLLFALLMVAWTIVTPGFRNPDEPQHVNSVLRVAEGEGWPPPSKAYMAPEVLRAKTLTGFSAIDGQVGNWAGGTLLPGVRAGVAPQDLMFYALFSLQSPTPVDDRLPFDALTLEPGVDLAQHGDQMTQHPPLYYAVDAGVLRAFGALDWRFDRTLALMRLCSVAMVLPLPLLAAATARRFTRRRRVADLAAFLPLAVPQLAALGGSVTNDALVILLGGVLTYGLARVLTGDRTWRTVVLVGVTLGLALLTKGTMLAAVPVAGLAVVVGARRAVALPWGPVLGRLAVVWGIGFGIGGWWWAVNYLRYGTFQPDGVPQDGLAGLVVDRPRVSVWAFGDVFWDKMTLTFWGDFGQLELPLAQPLVVALTVVLVLLALLAFRARGKRVPLLILLSFPVAVLLALFAGTYSAHLVYGRFGGIQGRYVYGGLIIILVAVALGLGEIARLAGRAGRAVLPVVVALALANAGYAMWFAFRGYYLDVDWTLAEGWERMVQWSPWPEWAVAGLGVAILLVGLIALGLAAVEPGPRAADGNAPSPEGVPADGPVPDPAVVAEAAR